MKTDTTATTELKALVIAPILLLGSEGGAFAIPLPGIAESGPLNFNFDEVTSPATSLRDALSMVSSLRSQSLTLLCPRRLITGHIIFTDVNYNQLKSQTVFWLAGLFR